MDFKNKTVGEVLTWLEQKGFNEWVREVFEDCIDSRVYTIHGATGCLIGHSLFHYTENEVDGEAFLLLTKKDMKELVTRVGPRVKLIREQATIHKLNLKAVYRLAKDTCKEVVHVDDNERNRDNDIDDRDIDDNDGNTDVYTDDNKDDDIDDNDGNKANDDIDDKDGKKNEVDDDDDDDDDASVIILCSEDQRLQQSSVVELNSPEDCKMLTVEEPFPLNTDPNNTIEDTGQNDNSTFFSSEMEYTDDNASGIFFPSDMSSADEEDDNQLRPGNTQELIQPPKKFREASTDLDASRITDYDEGLSSGHCTVVGVGRPNKKSQMKESFTCNKKMAAPVLPRPFQLPKHFPPSVNKDLSTGNLSGKARSRLIFTVASAVFEYTPYPTREDYDHVARQIVNKYEFMADHTGSYEYVIHLLEDKLAYLRSRRTRQRNEGQSIKRRRLSVYSPDPPLLPQCVDHDDSSLTSSYDRNLKMLQEEEKKPNPNRQVVMDLMKETFFIRRQNILKATMSVTSLLKIFPSLRSHAQIIAEFNRIMGKDMQAAYNDSWKTLMQNILTVAEMESDNIPVQTAIKLAGQNLSDDHKSILTLYCLCRLLQRSGCKADYRYIMTFIPENADVRLAAHDVITDDPNIIIRGGIAEAKDAFLVVEKELLCKLPGIDAALILLASIYVFNRRHEGAYTNLFFFLEHSIMGRSVPKKKTKLYNFLAQLAHISDKSRE